jgi:epoxyqueuosine reductase
MNTKEVRTQNLKIFIRSQGIDLVGIADLHRLEDIPSASKTFMTSILNNFHYAIVLGAQLNKLGKHASGSEVSMFLEKAAIDVLAYLEEGRTPGLIIHTEDEFDPIQRMGLLSLKVLAKAAGLGWQGRSLLIINPKYGPVHRWVAVLTGMDLQADKPISNWCGDCSLCVDKCPTGALTLMPFVDHPEKREDILNIQACLGDEGCKVCLVTCPWAKAENIN